MPALARQQLDVTQSKQWLTIEQAAKLTGESLRTWQRRAKWEAGKAKSGRCAVKAVMGQSTAKGRPTWYVHRSLDTALSLPICVSERDENDRVALVTKYPKHKVEQAYRKAYWLHRWRSACDIRSDNTLTELDLANRIVGEAKQVEGDELRVSARSLQLWRKRYSRRTVNGPIGLEALIDRRHLKDGDGGDGPSKPGRDVEAVEHFYKLFRTQQRVSVKQCHDATLRKAYANGWRWPASYQATHKWLALNDDLQLTYLMREGKDKYARKYMGYLEIDYTLIQPGEMMVTDHHQCDWWVCDGKKQYRPWLTVVQDMRTRCIVGWYLGESPHQDAIIAAYLMAFRDWSIPEKLRIDNGKDFASKLLTGVTKRERDALRKELGPDYMQTLQRNAKLVDCTDARYLGIAQELGIELIYAVPYQPWSKGQIERLFGTLEGQLGKTMYTYCGNSVLHKPEYLEEIRRGYSQDQKRALRKQYGLQWKKAVVLKLVDQSKIPPLEHSREAIGEWIKLYHNAKHSADDMAGRSPLEVWQTATTLRRAAPDELLFLMQSRGVYKVGPNGVKVNVGGQRISYGVGTPALYRYIGRDVFITLDPSDLSRCYAWTVDGDKRCFIATLESNRRISPNATVQELRDASANVNRRRKTMHKAHREASKAALSVSEELAADRRERLSALQATGTDDRTQSPNISPVRTTFNTTSKAVMTASKSAPVNRQARQRAENVAQALSGSYRVVHDEPKDTENTTDIGHLLTSSRSLASSDDEVDTGKDAETKRVDAFSLLAGHPHERT